MTAKGNPLNGADERTPSPTPFSIAYFPPVPLAYFNQPKALAAIQDFCVFIATNIYVSKMARRLEKNTVDCTGEVRGEGLIHRTSFRRRSTDKGKLCSTLKPHAIKA
jgi:hypothetical protein